MGYEPRAAMTRAYGVDHVQVILADEPIEVNIDEVQSSNGSPMAKRARFYVLARGSFR